MRGGSPKGRLSVGNISRSRGNVEAQTNCEYPELAQLIPDPLRIICNPKTAGSEMTFSLHEKLSTLDLSLSLTHKRSAHTPYKYEFQPFMGAFKGIYDAVFDVSIIIV